MVINMESVIEKIRKAQADSNIKETVINGFRVKMRFNPKDDNDAIHSVQSILVSAYLDAAFSAQYGGEGM